MDTQLTESETTLDSPTDILALNKDAMDWMKLGAYKTAVDLLKKAEDALKKGVGNTEKLSLLGITYNNFGCYYKERNKPKVALTYLKKALEIEQSGDKMSLAGSNNNICAIYSELQQHQMAFQHAQTTLKLLQQVELEDPERDVNQTKIITYLNLATESEHLRKYKQAQEYAEIGQTLAQANCEPGHDLIKKLKK